jgi:xanthine dehydrogenase small subunit
VVNRCLLFLPMLAGQEVYTVEGLSRDGRLSEPQRAIAEHGGSQCGYCTPGFAVSLFAEYHRPGRTGSCDPHAMGGNLCRCTGYRPLRDAALSLGTPGDDDFQRRLRQPAPSMTAFSLPNFERPATLSDCLALLDAHPDACLVAGATDLAVEANLRGRRWPLLVSVEVLPELRVFRDSAGEVEIGAGLTLSEIEARWLDAPAAMRDWFQLFASPLIRNRATLGGNLATASPVGDAAPLLMALDAQVNLASRDGHRRVPLCEFFRGYRQTAMRQGELIVSVSVPKPYPRHAAFFKVAKRALDDISTVAAAYAITLDGAGRVAHCRIAYGGVAATPVRVRAAEDALTGLPWGAPAVRDAQRAIAADLRPMSDHRGSAEYRLAVAQSLLEKFFYEFRQAEAA